MGLEEHFMPLGLLPWKNFTHEVLNVNLKYLTHWKQ